MVKYSVIGTSWITKSFIEGAGLHKGLYPYGVYSRNKEKGEFFRAENGFEVSFSSFEELLSSDTDLVYVASPNYCHYEQCKMLLERGKNVICEKPVTVTAEEFRELCRLSDAKGVVYFEAIMYMHAPQRQILKTAVRNIGKISSATLDFSQLSSKYPALKRGELPNIFNPEMKTGALNDLGIYCVYPAVDLFGMPEKITAAQSFLGTGADGSGTAVFHYPEMLVTITYSKTGQSRVSSEIRGDEGTVTLESISKLDNIRLFSNDGSCSLLWGENPKAVLMGNEAKSALDFIENTNDFRDFYEECRRMNENVLICMEKMRVENA